MAVNVLICEVMLKFWSSFQIRCCR